ncbi:hypothetical protein RUM43_012773 [Polyplax serrata]|uniref:Leucine-rich repeat-containing protein 27 n=1 Tax=Polyplax serrata TaxID=468196 RepID=A0AAN8RZC6_POLSC
MAATVTERKTSKASQERKFQDTSKLLRRERSKYLRHKFQQVVVQALLKKGDEGEDTNIEANSKGQDGCPIIPQEINTSLNLSRTNLKEFPIGLLDRLQHVEYLYLEEAKLTELPQNFFQKLPSLKWLDLRNNALVSLPIMGLRNHPNLEVILLQGNRIRNLPIELATIPFLKGLQTTGNPLTNVPYDCVAQGFSGIMNHLKKLCAQSEVLAPVSETILVKPSTSQESVDLLDDTLERPLADSVDSDTKLWDSDKLSQWRQFMKKKSNNSNTELQNLAAFNEKRPMQKPKVSVKIRGYPKTPLKAIPFRCGTYSKNRQRSTIATAQNNIRMKKTRLGYKRKPITLQMVEERARKNAHVAQVRETLEKQARKIQRMRQVTSNEK